MEVGGRGVRAVFEGGGAREDKVSAVQYVQFPVGKLSGDFLAGAPVRIVVDHGNYQATCELSKESRESLAEDLREE